MSNLSTLPKGDSAWLLRKAIERIIQQVSVLETNIGASTTGNSANTQVIFNDNGTLRGDPDLTFNKALNKLVATNLESTTTLVVGTSAAITGALTVTGAANLNGAVNLSLAGTATVTLGASSSYGLLVGSGANAASIYINGATAANASKLLYGASQHEWYNSSLSSLIATLNTTGLGIGASPATKLDVRGANNASQATFSGTASRGLLISTRSDGLADDRTVILNAQHSTGSLGQLVIQTAGTDRLLVDNAGNVGIGVTPSAWGSGYKSVQVNEAGGFAGKNDGLIVAQNCYFNGTNWVNNRASTFSSRYDMNVAGNGIHAWYVYNASFGTVGNTIPFTQAMTLDASGQLGIGAAATSRLTVNGEISVTDNFALRLGSNQAGGATLSYNGSGNLEITPRSGYHTRLVDGNLIMGTSGKGIDFSAVTGGTGTATANVLNDYEEGTWTPTISASAGTITTSTVTSANYTKIGRVVSVNFDIRIDALGTATGGLIVSLPFSASGGATCGVGREIVNTGYIVQVANQSATEVIVYFYNNLTVIANTNRVVCSYTYFV